MRETELESMLSARVKGCVASRCHSSDLADRLRISVRHSRRAFQIRLTALVAVVVVTAMLMVGLTGRKEQSAQGEAALVAAQENSGGEKVSGWMFLGIFRDIFKKNKVNKRREENAR